jgi:hypothetical protein
MSTMHTTIKSDQQHRDFTLQRSLGDEHVSSIISCFWHLYRYIFARTHVTQPYQLTAHRLAIDPLIFHARFAAHMLDFSVQGQSDNTVLAT